MSAWRFKIRLLGLPLILLSTPLLADAVKYPELLNRSETQPILKPAQPAVQMGLIQQQADQNVQQRSQMQNSSDSRGAINPQTGQFYPRFGRGVVNPQTGEFYPPSGGSFINPGTLEHYPPQ